MPAVQEGFSPEALEANFAGLTENVYPGRLIVQGLTAVDGLVQAYAIMGRRTGSRNRNFERFPDGNSVGVRTAPHVVNEGEDHSLTIYNAMRDTGYSAHVVTNGEQTDDLVDAIRRYTVAGKDPEDSFLDELNNWGFEPDGPNWTPRINGLLDTHTGLSTMVYMKKGEQGHRILRTVSRRALDVAGVGFCLHTYDADGDPLPPFTGEPYAIPLGETAEEVAEELWTALNPDNKVSLAVKAVNRGPQAFILKNKHLGD